MILKPITSEKAVKMIEIDNTLLFSVERECKKAEIRKEIEKLFKVKVSKIRTLIHGNKKLAYVRLNSENPAIDVATKLGVI